MADSIQVPNTLQQNTVHVVCLVHPVVAVGSRMRAALRCMMSLRLVGSSSARIEKELMFGPELRMGTGLKCSNSFGYLLRWTQRVKKYLSWRNN